MGKNKKKDGGFNPKFTRTIVSWIQNASTVQLGNAEAQSLDLTGAELTSQLRTAKTLADDPDSATAMEEFQKLALPLQVALVELLAEEGAVGFLARARRDAQDKTLAKAISATIYKAQTRGLSVPDLAPRAGVSFQAVAEGPPASYVSAIDGEGTRVVVLARQSSTQGISVMYAMTNDSEGLQHIEGAPMPRSAYRRFVKMIGDQIRSRLVPVEEAYAAGIITEAKRISDERGNPVSPDFETLKSNLAAASSDSQPPTWSVFTREQVKGWMGRLAETETLHDEPEYAAWLPDEEGLDTLSKIMGTDPEAEPPAEPKTVDDAKIAQVLATWLTPERRERFARRLEENAFVLSQTERMPAAELSLTVAAALRDAGRAGSDIPFVKRLITKVTGAGLPIADLLKAARHDHGHDHHGHDHDHDHDHEHDHEHDHTHDHSHDHAKSRVG